MRSIYKFAEIIIISRSIRMIRLRAAVVVVELAVPSVARTVADHLEADAAAAEAAPSVARSPPGSGTASAWPSGSDRPPDSDSRAD